MPEVIASAQLIAIRNGTERMPVSIRIAAPVHEPTGEWSCQLGLSGLEDNLPPMRGEDALQALCLALGLGASLLRGFVETGGRLELPSGDEFPLEAYFAAFTS